MQPVVLVCGVAGAGKSWVCRQLQADYCYIAHDRCWSHPTAKPSTDPRKDAAWGPPGSVSTHFEEILGAARGATKPVLTEAPFGERRLRDQLTLAGVDVTPVFVIENAATITKRFLEREGSMPSQGVLTRLAGLRRRAIEWGAFHGPSAAVLAHLKRAAPSRLTKRRS